MTVEVVGKEQHSDKVARWARDLNLIVKSAMLLMHVVANQRASFTHASSVVKREPTDERVP